MCIPLRVGSAAKGMRENVATPLILKPGGSPAAGTPFDPAHGEWNDKDGECDEDADNGDCDGGFSDGGDSQRTTPAPNPAPTGIGGV